MKNKIFWLSILGLALARPPNPIDSTASNIGEQQKQRSSRSIWPFTSSATTTEVPVTYPPPPLENNEWFVQGETALPQEIDLTKYPVWKVHKYHGLDLHPVNLQPENTYPPEVDPAYVSGFSSSSDFSQNGYQNGYQDFLASRGQTDLQSQSVHGTHSTGYSASPVTYHDEQETHQAGEFFSSSFIPGTNPFSIQTQQIQSGAYAPPQPFQDFRATAGSGIPEFPQNPQVSNGNNPDLSFLDDLGGLAPFLPEPTGDKESSNQQENSDTSQKGFFENLFARFRGSPAASTTDVAVDGGNEKTTNSGGFLSSVFGLGGGSQSSETGSSGTESSGSAFSSLFYQPQTEKPAVVLPTTYYLPKTRGSYIAVKFPTNPASSFTPSGTPNGDVSNLAFHEVPKVPFNQYEIPHISGPTLDTGYYNHGYPEVRNSMFAGSTIGTDYQPPVVYDQTRTITSQSASHLAQSHGNYQSTDFEVGNSSPYHEDGLDVPHAEYLYSGNNNQANGGSSSSSQSSSETSYHHQEQQNSQDARNFGIYQVQSTAAVPQLVDELPGSYVSTITSSNADQSDQNQNLNTQEYHYQNFDTTNSNFQSISNAQANFEHKQESTSFGQTVNENEPISAPQISDGFIPSLSYGIPVQSSGQVSHDTNNQENTQEITSTSDNNAYDYSRDLIAESFSQKYGNSPFISIGLEPPKKQGPAQGSVPFYQTPAIAFQDSGNSLEPTNSYEFVPVKEADGFYGKSTNQDDGDSRFIQNLSALTSYGIPTVSYNSNSWVPAASNTRSIAVPPPMKDEVNDGSNINMDKNEFRSTLPEQSPTMKAGRVIRKVVKRKNLFESNQRRRSAPERQASTEEADTSLLIRSEKDSMPEVRGSRHFDGTKVIDGYSKVQRQQHEEHRVVADNPEATKPINPVPKAADHE